MNVMRFDTRQQMGLGQHMKLAPRMIQSMEILQLPLAALQERIEQEQRIQQSELLPVELDAGQPAPLQLQIRALESVGTLRRRAVEEPG